MTSTAISRLAALVALVVAVVVVVLLLSGGEKPYEITGEFENASQLVPGNEVIVGGVRAGSVKEIELGDDGQALVTFSVDPEYAPLKRGTTATVRSYSLSGIANRQVQLTIPPDSETGEEIPNGGTLSQSETVSEVDLDEIFNTLDPETVEDFKHVIQGFEISYDGVGRQANRGFRYLNPFLSTSRGLFAELTFDERALERLIVDSAELSGALAARAPEITALIGNLDVMMGAIANQKLALAEAISKFPGFMREANTTFVNLRFALDDLDPLVEASKPAALELQEFMPELRAAVADAVPTIRDLDAIVKRPGADNDLVELTRLQPALAEAGVGTGSPDCGADRIQDYDDDPPAADDDFTQGSFGETVCSLRNSLPQLSMLRAYSPEFVGWFDGFSHPGYIDAIGGIGRVSTSFNTFTFSQQPGPNGEIAPNIDPLDPTSTIVDQLGLIVTDLDQRCPGMNDRPLPQALGGHAEGGNPYLDPDGPVPLNCDKSDRIPSP